VTSACVYCATALNGDRRAHPTLPDWLRERLEVPALLGAGRRIAPDGKKEAVAELDADVPACPACEQEAAALDATVAPLLGPLVDWTRHVSELSGPERLLLSRWAASTGLALAHAAGERAVGLTSHAALWQRPDTLPRQMLVVALQHPGSERFGWVVGPYWDPPGARRSQAESDFAKNFWRSYKVTLQLGKLLLMVAYWPSPHWRYVLWRGMHVPMWPLRGACGFYKSDPQQFPWHDSANASLAFHCALLLSERRG
jgi:hypothetical protein